MHGEIALGNAPISQNILRQFQVVGQHLHAIKDIDLKLAGDVMQ